MKDTRAKAPKKTSQRPRRKRPVVLQETLRATRKAAFAKYLDPQPSDEAANAAAAVLAIMRPLPVFEDDPEDREGKDPIEEPAPKRRRKAFPTPAAAAPVVQLPAPPEPPLRPAGPPRLLRPWERWVRNRIEPARPLTRRERELVEHERLVESVRRDDAVYAAQVKDAQALEKEDQKRRDREQRTGTRKVEKDRFISLDDAYRQGFEGD